MKLIAVPFRVLLGVGLLMTTGNLPLAAQDRGPPRPYRSSNVHVLSHVPLGEASSVSEIEVEQEPHRPYAYLARRGAPGFDIIDFSDPEHARLVYSWRIESPELHQGGGTNSKYFKHQGRYYYVLSVQLGRGGANGDLGAIVFDITSLPDTAGIREVGRIRAPQLPGGFHNVFTYKHSDGRPLLFATSGPGAAVYDLDRFLKGDTDYGHIGRVPVEFTPDALSTGYHDFYIHFDVESQQDRFYGAGGGGYYVYDVTRPESPELVMTITSVPGYNWGHTFTPSPDGRYAVGEAEWQYQPLRLFDLKPALDGEATNIDRPIGAIHSDWRTVAHNHEVRWPYVFVSGYETGLQVFSMIDPDNPYLIGWYDTFKGPHNARGNDGGDPMRTGNFTWGVYDGAWGVDVRNIDGIIVISDMTTGFWALRMDGFGGWNGRDWGMPNISSVQDWDNGPEGVQRSRRPVF